MYYRIMFFLIFYDRLWKLLFVTFVTGVADGNGLFILFILMFFHRILVRAFYRKAVQFRLALKWLDN